MNRRPMPAGLRAANRDQSSQARVAQKEAEPEEHGESRLDEKWLSEADVVGNCPAHVAREQNGSEHGGAWDEIENGAGELDGAQWNRGALGPAGFQPVIHHELGLDELDDRAGDQQWRGKDAEDPPD